MKEDSEVWQETVRLRNLTTGYHAKDGEKVISHGLNVSLLRSSLTCLLGPNGGGKSTLIKTIAGFLKPLGGEVEIDGKSLTRIKPSEMSKLISVVLTERGYINAMTGKELVELGRSPYTGFFGRLTKEDKEAVEKAIEAVGAQNLTNRQVVSLSDGERQKLMIAKALAQDTHLIILDEPTAFLDFPSKVEIMLLMRELGRKHNKTVLLSTHDLDIALAITDNLWLLDKNLGFCSGTVKEIGENGELDRYFRHKGLRYDPKERHFKITA